MPTYQYACTACLEPLEAVQAFTDPALTECPLCGARLRKVYSAVGVVFKGSGFYKNDSRPAAKDGSSSEKQSDKQPEKQSDKPAEKKADAPAAKASSTSDGAARTAKPAAVKTA